ncbi:MAG: hypothetical protein ACI81L_002455 [Verrucomicrobiales bacterium]|jgi:hypothetical protein
MSANGIVEEPGASSRETYDSTLVGAIGAARNTADHCETADVNQRYIFFNLLGSCALRCPRRLWYGATAELRCTQGKRFFCGGYDPEVDDRLSVRSC